MSKYIHRFVVTDLLNHRSSHIPSRLSCHKRSVPARKEPALLLLFVPGWGTKWEYSCDSCSHLRAASATSELPRSSVALYLYTRSARRDPTICTSSQHFHNKARAMRADESALPLGPLKTKRLGCFDDYLVLKIYEFSCK